MKIRTVTGADMPDLTDLWCEFMDFHAGRNPFFTRTPDGHEHFMTWLREQADKDDFTVIVAEDEAEDGPVGYCTATIKETPPVFALKRFGYIQDMAVTAAWRRRGVARDLFAAARTWLSEQGVDRIQLTVDAANPVSQSFWREMGFGPHTETWAQDI